MKASLAKIFNRSIGKAFTFNNKNLQASNNKYMKDNKGSKDEIEEHSEDLNRLGNDFRMDVSQQEDKPMAEDQKFEKDAKLTKDEKIDEKYDPFAKDTDRLDKQEKGKTIISNKQ
jgi:hypothetical protein